MHLGRQVEESRAEFFRELPSLFRVDSRRELLLEHPPVNERLRNLPHGDARIELASDAFHDDHRLLQKQKIGLELHVESLGSVYELQEKRRDVYVVKGLSEKGLGYVHQRVLEFGNVHVRAD